MLLISTGLKTKLLGAAAFVDIFELGAIYIYPGARPATADAAPGQTPIGMVTQAGLAWNPINTAFGLSFMQQGPYIVFAPSVSAQLLPSDIGVAAWWRLVAPGDTGETSYSQPRIDGDIGLKSSPGGQEMLLDTNTLSTGIAQQLGYFLYTIPPIGA